MYDSNKKSYRLFAPAVSNMQSVSERFSTEAEAKQRKREILMAYPAATVRIVKADDTGRTN
jgi:hypothetical protein